MIKKGDLRQGDIVELTFLKERIRCKVVDVQEDSSTLVIIDSEGNSTGSRMNTRFEDMTFVERPEVNVFETKNTYVKPKQMEEVRPIYNGLRGNVND